MSADGLRRDAASPRVKVVHAQTRRALTLATAFAVAAGVATTVPHRTGAWLELHLFLVGAVLLAISGATRLFSVTWSAGEPVTGWPVAVQRWLVAGGAAGLAAGRELGWPPPLLAAAGFAVTAGLVVLAVLLVIEARTAKVRRYHPAVAFYLAAVAAGLAGTLLGAAMVSGRSALRDSHVVLNVLGLVGLVIAGTLPFFVATEARMKMNRRATPARLHRALAWMVVATGVAATGAVVGASEIEGAALGAYAAGVVYLVTLLPVPGRKQIAWAGPRLVLLGAGVAWWAGAVAFAAVEGLRGEGVLTERVLVALVLGGYAQIVLGSLAYLGPVLRGGGHERLTRGFAQTRSWLAVASVNAAAVAWVAGAERVVRVAVVVIAADVVWRAARLVIPDETRPAARVDGAVWAGSGHGRAQAR